MNFTDVSFCLKGLLCVSVVEQLLPMDCKRKYDTWLHLASVLELSNVVFTTYIHLLCCKMSKRQSRDGDEPEHRAAAGEIKEVLLQKAAERKADINQMKGEKLN